MTHDNTIFRAMLYASNTHLNDVRRYTNEPYFVHLAEVASLAGTVLINPEHIAVAWLHDTMEMNKLVKTNGLTYIFGWTIAQGVRYLTDDFTITDRKERKLDTIARLSKAPAWVQTIKIADMISNVSSIIRLDKEFAKVYVPECYRLMFSLREADNRLKDVLEQIINKWEKENHGTI